MWPWALPIEQEVKYVQNQVYIEYAMSQGHSNKHLHILKSIVQDSQSQEEVVVFSLFVNTHVGWIFTGCPLQTNRHSTEMCPYRKEAEKDILWTHFIGGQKGHPIIH